jgi:hypothetical protein
MSALLLLIVLEMVEAGLGFKTFKPVRTLLLHVS